MTNGFPPPDFNTSCLQQSKLNEEGAVVSKSTSFPYKSRKEQTAVLFCSTVIPVDSTLCSYQSLCARPLRQQLCWLINVLQRNESELLSKRLQKQPLRHGSWLSADCQSSLRSCKPGKQNPKWLFPSRLLVPGASWHIRRLPKTSFCLFLLHLQDF